MGEVYKARDSVINRLVALKTITNTLAHNNDLLERFYQEARAAGTLQHPNIVTIFELNKEGETPYIAMEFLEGESLERIIARKPTLSISEKLGYVVPVCRALDYAHKRGIVHRDVKPANIMATSDGTVKVVDFGIARLVDAGLTQTNMLIGTIAYMSPQQIQGERADERSDIWAMGVTCYELLAGERPFVGDNHAAMMMKIITEKPKPLSEVVSGCPPDLDAVVARMMHKDISERFQTMEEALLELEPVWRRLQLGTVSRLIESGETLLNAQQLMQAQRVLREALQIDSSNTAARTLLEKTNVAIRRSQLMPKLHERVEKGGQLLAFGQAQEARAEAEAALKMDSTFEPAKGLLAGVQAAADYGRLVGDGLRIAKQFLASGAILDAHQKLETVLSLDPQNKTALELWQSVRDEVARRQQRQHFSEAIQQARLFWTEQRYTQCLTLLAELAKDFPDDPELLRLRETARQDQQEFEKSRQISEVRKLVAGQHFDGALTILAGLIELHPADSGISSLRSLVLQQRDGEARQKQSRSELVALRALLDGGKYEEAARQGETLLQQAPQDFELRELVTFAREEMAQISRKQRFEELLGQVNDAMGARHFGEAIRLAELGLKEFPENGALSEQLVTAKLEQKDQEGKARVQAYLRNIESLMEKDELTEAIDVARQTLMTLGPNTAVTNLLTAAEFEFKTREKQKEQKREIATMRTLINDGKLEEAKSALEASIKTDLFEPFDPRIATIQDAIVQREAAAQATPSIVDAGQFAKDYIFQRAAAPTVETNPSAVLGSAQASTLNVAPTNVVPSVAQPAIQPLPPAPTIARATNSENVLEAPLAAQQSSKVPMASMTATAGASVDAPPARPPIPLQPDAQLVAAPPVAGTGAPWKRLAIIVFAVALLSTAAVVFYVKHKRKVIEATPQELKLKFDAENSQYDRHLTEALEKYTKLAALHGALEPAALDSIQTISALLQQENSLMADAKAAENSNDLPRAHTDYEKIVALQGEREEEAKESLVALDKKQAGASDADIAAQSFQSGVTAFNGRDYAGAKAAFDQALQRGGDNWPQRAQATSYARRSAQRIFQEQLLKRAQYEFKSNDVDAARNDAQQASNNSDGDAQLTTEARSLLAKIPKAGDAPGASTAAPAAPGTMSKAATIQQLTAEAQTLTQGGLYSAADDKANSIGKLGGDAAPVWRMIKEAEEKKFHELDARYRSVNKKSAPDLQALLNMVQQLQNNGFYEKQDAKQEADAIAADLRALAPHAVPDSTPAQPVKDDGAEILRVVNRFAAAFNSGDLNQVKEVRRLTPKEEKKMNEAMKAQQGTAIALHDCSAARITGDTAQISCTVVSDITHPRNTTYSLQRDGSRWMIVGSN
jgi:eukaryotic-like serine/threonine-protein kinase